MQINKKLAINGGEPTLDFSLSPYKSLGKKESDYVNKVLGSQNLSGFYGSPGENFYGGKYVRELEKRWCERFGCKYAVSINSNTSGLFAAIGALGLNPGEEIIMPALTMSATAIAPLFWGVIPDFVDVDRETYTLDIDEVEPYSRAGDRIQVTNPGFETRDPVLYDEFAQNYRWKASRYLFSKAKANY